MRKCKVVLADDHAILTESTSFMLSTHEDIELIGVASDGEQLHQLIQMHKPDVLVSDISMPGRSIFDITEEIKRTGLPTKVLIFTMHESADYVQKALRHQVDGYLTKNADTEELISAIKSLSKGGEYYSQTVNRVVIAGLKKKQRSDEDSFDEKNPLSALSKRELEVLSLISEGLSSKQIAEKLYLSERTISNHRANMLQKSRVHTTVELVRLYLEEKKKGSIPD
ncbi:response regulator transcription factor [Porifericola rhodea]|uniref:response regulator transcription factor n=1 Tax=Porifericola rhodea TaxID=930972 RepID=UPI002666EDC4|nr:response regulator transcription factor [Porifericola rhodea]WKN30166.1 response regulator transcription factor [Porifericola rhodea]